MHVVLKVDRFKVNGLLSDDVYSKVTVMFYYYRTGKPFLLLIIIVNNNIISFILLLNMQRLY